jgi:hypothetical protein
MPGIVGVQRDIQLGKVKRFRILQFCIDLLLPVRPLSRDAFRGRLQTGWPADSSIFGNRPSVLDKSILLNGEYRRWAASNVGGGPK